MGARLILRKSQCNCAPRLGKAFIRLCTTYASRIPPHRYSRGRLFLDLAGKTVVPKQGTISERILKKIHEEKMMNMQIICAKDYAEGRLMLATGSAVAYTIDDVLLTGTRSLFAQPSGWVIVVRPQSSEADGFMLRKGRP